MRTVWKYRFEGRTLEMQVGARVVHVDRQDGVMCLWAEVDTAAGREMRRFEVVGTGHPIEDDWRHVHSWQDPPFVWHLYEVGS